MHSIHRRARFLLILSVLILTLTCDLAIGQLRIVSYNTATSGGGLPSSPRPGMENVLEAIGNEVRLGISKPIDVLALQEQELASTTTQDFVDLLNGIYGAGTYARSNVNGNTLGAGRVGLVYNTQTVELISSTPVGNVSGNGASRQPVRYQLRPVGYTSDADVFLYNSHYNATSTSRRNVEAQATRANADALGQGAKVIFAGDYNIDSSNEAMYQTLLSGGNGQAFDPVNSPGNWSGSFTFRALHTQSPYDSSNNDPNLIAGGMDDRFDFQLVSGELNDVNGLSYMGGTYRAFGNNGSHSVNDAINDPSNTANSPAVLDALASVSDHLPVVADYRLPAIMEVATGAYPDRVILGASAAIDVQIYNGATPVAAQGADGLDYTVAGLNGVMGSSSGSDNALGNMPTVQLQLDTSTLGLRTGNVLATTTSQDVPESSITLSTPFQVLLNAAPSFSPFNVELETDIDFGIVIPDSGALTEQFAIVNLIQPATSANLDLDAFTATGDTVPFSTDLSTFSGLAPNDLNVFSMDLDTTTSGDFSATWDITVSDEDIPGEASSQMTLNVSACVTLPGDANLDGTVDGLDFIIWNENKFSSGTDFVTGDFNFDGLTDGLDFIVWNENKFQNVGCSTSQVPEPSGMWLVIASLMIFKRNPQ